MGANLTGTRILHVAPRKRESSTENLRKKGQEGALLQTCSLNLLTFFLICLRLSSSVLLSEESAGGVSHCDDPFFLALLLPRITSLNPHQESRLLLKVCNLLGGNIAATLPQHGIGCHPVSLFLAVKASSDGITVVVR